MCDVVSLGELLIDFTNNGISENGNILFEANPGGAPCNVLAMLSKLGRKTGFIGKVGDDILGNLLKKSIEDSGIDSSSLILDKNSSTTQAFVMTNEVGERSFSFFRNDTADTRISKDEIDSDVIFGSKIFHFGSLSLTHETAREATEFAVKTAMKADCIISFDPNLRKNLWNNLQEAKERILWGLAHSHVVKIADDELEFLFGISDAQKGYEIIKKLYPNIKMLFITYGKNGSYGFCDGVCVYKKAFLTLDTIDTTGAGDTFMGCVLDFVLEQGLNADERHMSDLLTFANAAAGLVTTKKGALRSMPEKCAVTDLIKTACE